MKKKEKPISDNEVKEFLEEFFDRESEQNLPSFTASRFCVLTVDSDHNLQLALYIGLSLLCDKPLVLLVAPGYTIPARLRQVADAVLEVGGFPLDGETKARFQDVLRKIIDRQEATQ